MEKVKVVKAIPGMLNEGDVLISPEAGCDFCLEEQKKAGNTTSTRYVSLDYSTVSANIPEFFEFVVDEEEDAEVEYVSEVLNRCENCEDCTCEEADEAVNYSHEPFAHRTNRQIEARYKYFSEQFEDAEEGSEAQVVYKNLMWFIEWLYGFKELE